MLNEGDAGADADVVACSANQHNSTTRRLDPTLRNPIRPLAIMSANIRGLCQGKFKIKLLKEKATEDNAGIIALTESHLNENYLPADVHMES